MVEVRRYGPTAILVAPPAPLALALALRERADPRIVDVVPAAETVLVSVARAADVAGVTELVVSLGETAGPDPAPGPVVELDVVYDGPDLDAVAAASKLSVDEVVRRHTEVEYRSRFCGFAPGFAYLDGLDPSLVVPRRAEPRTSVAAGAVAVAGPFTAVYPTSSPGGWNLLGRTDAVLWDAASADPALLPPGTVVRFRPVDELAGAPPPRRVDAVAHRPTGRPGVLEVVAAGWASSVQDAGRAGLAHLGVPAAGAIDPARRDQLNRLVGNPPDAAVIETLGGLRLAVAGPVVVADSASGAVTTLGAGSVLHVDPGPGETWATLAVRGGVDAPRVLGSRSADTLSGLGPPLLREGDRLGVGPDPRTAAGELAPPAPLDDVVGVELGPRADWFTAEALDALTRTAWRISHEVSRIGARLIGPPLDRTAAATGRELPSEGLVTGAVQVPPNGQPIVMLADHPTTGGYPVIAVVTPDDLAKVVRRRPGDTLRFRLRG